ncbi:MAG: hypothetical protein WC805_01910 [Patescibacteria group bacterium]|jgi:hypothetical protein
MSQIWLIPLKEVYLFLRWWSWEIPADIFRATQTALLDFDNILQFEANFRLWLAVEPLFGDYTWAGRLVGLLLRGVRVLFTLVIYTGVLLLGLVIIASWWLLPVATFYFGF